MAGAVALTLAPADDESFLAEHWERRPLLVERDEPGRFDAVLSAGDVERLVCEGGLRAPALRLVRDGAPLRASDYLQDVSWRPEPFAQMAVVERVAAEHARGATLVLQGLHLFWRPAALFCRGLERWLGVPVQANAYATPAAAQGFSVHHDTHDVFVLQVSGQKNWRVYAPVIELPLRTQRWSAACGDPGSPVLELTLRAGDTLYLPRGWPHEALTDNAESLHLTIGLHPPTRLDALRAALEACADDVAFRRAVDPGGRLPADLLERLEAQLEPATVERRARRRFVATRRAILDDQLAQVRAAADLGLDDAVERRATVLALLERAGDAVVLVFEGKELRLPVKVHAALAAALDAQEPFAAASLPGPLDEAGRLVLVRRLVREGLLRIV